MLALQTVQQCANYSPVNVQNLTECTVKKNVMDD